MPRPRAATILAAALTLALAAGGPARARAEAAPPWARFQVPDSLLKTAVLASRADFENVWNALYLAELRAVSGSKNALVTEQAARLLDLERRVAVAERDTLGSHIGDEALVLRYRWTNAERDQRIAAAVAESLAVLAQGQQRLERAESQFRAALAIYHRLGERRREAWVTGSLGVVAYARGDIARADSIYRAALVLRRELGDPRLIGNTLNSLGITSQQLRRYPAAYDYFREARVVRAGLRDTSATTNTLNLLGVMAAQNGQPDSAAIWYEQALSLAVAAGDSGRVAEVLVNSGLLQAAGGDHAAAEAAFARARTIARARGDLRLQASVERAIADMRRRQGRFGEAAQGLQRAIAADERLGDLLTLAQDLITLGRIAVNARDPGLGRPPLERAVAIGDSLRNAALQAPALVHLATLVAIEGDDRGAERLGTRALSSAMAAGDSSLVHAAATILGELHADRGDWKGARVWYDRALGAGRRLPDEERAGDHTHVAMVAAHTGRPEEAERAYRAALDLAERAGLADAAWPATLGLGDLAGRRGDFAGALAYGRRAAGMIDTLRAAPGAEAPPIEVLDRRRVPFEALIHLLGTLDPAHPDSGYAAEAFQWAERARARAFLDRVPGGGEPGGRALTLAEARNLLGSDREALLEYSVGDSSTALWVVTRRAARLLMLPPRATLRARAAILRRGLGDPTGALRHSTLAAARELEQALIEPAAKDLSGVSRLVISADDALALIPFEALLAADAPAENALPDPTTYLVARYTVSYAPSATVLASLRAAEKVRTIVALGDPRFAADSGAAGSRPLPPLPQTAGEVAALRALAGSRRFVGLTGADATRARLLGLPELREAGILHLATHAVAREDEPGRSGLWLAGEGSGPGFLAVDDILAIPLRAEVVTLSACETGLGRLEGGEGVLGLTRAFLVAGARSVVVSLWSVEGQSTATFIEDFYRALLQRGQPREDALAAAKRALLAAEGTRSPYYWAPFVIAGEGGKLK
ncbi:MAG TPA: CHAT domain-containing tetratricopeptide repeat protein [Candidatus Eisenbacteria bacterium]